MYGRQGLSLPRLTNFVKKLLITLFSSYVALLILEGWQGVPLSSMLALHPGGLEIWQLGTYLFVAGGNPLMFLFGLLVLWWILAPFEIGFGQTRTAQLVVTCVVGAAVPAWLAGFVIPGSPPLYGSGPLWLGALAASTYLYKDQKMSLLGAVTMTAKQFLLLIVGLSVLMFLANKDHTHFIADLGGIASGIGFVKYLRRPRQPAQSTRQRSKNKGFRVIEGGGGSDDNDGGKWLN